MPKLNLMLKIDDVWVGIPRLCSEFLDSPSETESPSVYASGGLSRRYRRSLTYADSPKRAPLLFADITLTENAFDNNLKTKASVAIGSLHLFAEDFDDFLTDNIKSWDALVIDEDSNQVVLAGKLKFLSDADPIIVERIQSSIRPVSFEIKNAIDQFNFDTKEVFNPFNADMQEMYLWNSDYPDESIAHKIVDFYEDILFDVAYQDLPFKTRSFSLNVDDNILDALTQLFYEVGYYLRVENISTLNCERINLEVPEEEEELEKIDFIKCHTVPRYSRIKREIRNPRITWAETKVKSVAALKAEGRAIWSGRSSFAVGDNGEAEVTPFATIIPNGYYPPFSDVQDSYNSIDPSFLQIYYKIDIKTQDFWFGSKREENQDISIISIFDPEYAYKASPYIKNPDNPHPAQTEVKHFKWKNKEFALSIHNTLPEDFESTLEDDGIRQIEWIEVYGNVIYRARKNFISLKEPKSNDQSGIENLYYINDRDQALAFFNRIKTHWDYGNLVLLFDSDNNYELNKLYKIDNQIGSIRLVSIISKKRDVTTGIYSYEALNAYKGQIYDEEEWGENVEPPVIGSTADVRNRFSSPGIGYVCDYRTDTTTISNADQFAKAISGYVRLFNGIYLLRESVTFKALWKVYVDETVDPPVTNEVRIEMRPSVDIKWAKAPEEFIERVLNLGVGMSPKKTSFLFTAGNDADSVYLY